MARKTKGPLSEKSSKPAIEQQEDAIEVPNTLDDFEDFEGFDSTDEEPEEEAVEEDAEESVSSVREQAEKEKISKLASKATAGVSSDKDSGKRGVVYVGRIPHGLYEDQLRGYFEQFGTISRLRISRNKKTGASKHFGFVEFASREVATIVCETMNNYLLFGHLLKVNMMDPNQIHPEIWTGANRKFHAIPWDLVNKQRNDRKHSREWWEEKQKEFEEEKKAKARKLAELGIIY